MYSRRRLGWVGSTCVVLACSAAWAADMGTAFTYQGYLEKSGTPVTGVTCNFRVGLWDAVTGGAQHATAPQTSPQTVSAAVDSGTFTIVLDYGDDAIDGTARWLAIEVQCPGDGGFTALTPRVELTPAPHALALPGNAVN